MTVRIVLAIVLSVTASGLLVACGNSVEGEPNAADATLELTGVDGSVSITVEIVNSASERGRGLAGRDQLPPGSGMLFANGEDVSTGFHMRDTTIPLSLAFIDGAGTIIEVLDMAPCAREPCEVFRPQAPYRWALEVNQGAFADWNIAVGDQVSVSAP